MNVDKIIAAIPGQTIQERKALALNAMRWLAEGTEAQKADAARVLNALEERKLSETGALHDRMSSLPRARRVIEAFIEKPLTENDRKIVQALLDNPGATTTELSRAYGHDSMIWQMHFGNMCKDREAYLWPAQVVEKRNASFYCGILADEVDNRFTMKPDVAAAFEELGLTPRRTPP